MAKCGQIQISKIPLTQQLGNTYMSKTGLGDMYWNIRTKCGKLMGVFSVSSHAHRTVMQCAVLRYNQDDEVAKQKQKQWMGKCMTTH